jgi:DNA replication protein DnaC
MDRFEPAKMATETRQAECPEHGAFESKGIALPFAERLIWTQCPACEADRTARETAEKRAAEERARQKRIEERLDRAGVPLRFRGKSLESFVAKTPEQHNQQKNYNQH